MHIHILGICGTFMGSLAMLARAQGHEVTGCDANVYPPMSTQLEAQGIGIIEGYDPAQLEPQPDLVVIGNAMSRGNPVVEAVLNRGLPYTSGPAWLAEQVLQGRWVLGVAGTHGKTTTSSMLAWILECAGMQPGFLIGGVPANFGISARLGQSDFFVIEADEYDSAFFDKRSKFVHYHPRTCVLNNLEFDHADIFDNLEAIKKQFHHLVRTIPGEGQIVYPAEETAIADVLSMGCWSGQQSFRVTDSANSVKEGWQAAMTDPAGCGFDVWKDDRLQGQVQWELTGRHSVSNGMAALLAARHVGVSPEIACEALSSFLGVKRRMELRGQVGMVKVYDDFAHHPTAIKTTLEGLRKQVGDERVLAIIEPRSNTMRLGSHQARLPASVEDADEVIWFQPASVDWALQAVVDASSVKSRVFEDIDEIVDAVSQQADRQARPLHVVIMSNGGFGGIHERLLQQLQTGGKA